MILELGKALSFFACIVAMYFAAAGTLFAASGTLEDRMLLALLKLILFACVCLASGLVFAWPTPTNPDARQPLSATLPVRFFFWVSGGMVLLFGTLWYLMCGGPAFGNAYGVCSM